jgi:hypothetical protein
MDIYRYLILNDCIIDIKINEEKEGYATLMEDGSFVDWTKNKIVNGMVTPIPPPDPDPPYVPTLEEKMSIINAKYQPKLDYYKDLIVTAMASDGATQATKIASNQVKYNALVTQKNTELEALEVD